MSQLLSVLIVPITATLIILLNSEIMRAKLYWKKILMLNLYSVLYNNREALHTYIYKLILKG